MDVINEVIWNSDFIRGKHMVPFENEFAKAIGTKHCISCANGTDALYIAMKALDIQNGDEVITTSHTWISSSETITQAGGRVIFCDTEKDSFNIDVQKIESKITKNTKGIIAVHLCGQPCDLSEIKAIAEKYGLWIIEDCAQSHFAEYKNKKVGTFGDIATFSFYPGKNLGAMGDAGAIVTNNSKLAEWVELFARHGGKGNHLIEGINSRLDGLQAAILRTKLPHLQKWTEMRQAAASRYNELLKNVDGIKVPIVKDDRTHVYHLYMIKCNHRDKLQECLKQNGISTVINYPRALPFYKAYDYLKHSPHEFPNSFENQSKILSIPIFPEITIEQQSYVVEVIKNSIKNQ